MECYDEETRDCPCSYDHAEGDTGLSGGFDGGETVNVNADGDLDEAEDYDVEEKTGVEGLKCKEGEISLLPQRAWVIYGGEGNKVPSVYSQPCRQQEYWHETPTQKSR